LPIASAISAARQHSDQVRAVLGAAVDVAVYAFGRGCHVFEQFRRKAVLERFHWMTSLTTRRLSRRRSPRRHEFLRLLGNPMW
jgi:hypothetical protein